MKSHWGPIQLERRLLRRGYVARILVVEALIEWAGRDARTIEPREIIERPDTIVARGAKVMANRVATVFRELFLHAVHRTRICGEACIRVFRGSVSIIS